MSHEAIRQLSQLAYEDRTRFGDKAVRLAELARAGFPVPASFVIGESFFGKFLEGAKLESRLKNLFRRLRLDHPKELATTSRRIQDLIIKTPLPRKLLADYDRAVTKLLGKNRQVAVRVSLVEAALPDSRFYGQHVSFLALRGQSEVLSAIKHVWAAFFESKAVAERLLHQEHVADLPFGIIVQEFVPAVISGLTASQNPATQNPGETLTEAIRGLSLPLTEGIMEPSRFLWDTSRGIVLEASVEPQAWMLDENQQTGSRRLAHHTIPKHQVRERPLTDQTLGKVSDLAIKAAALWHEPVVLEWVETASGELSILRVELLLADAELVNTPEPNDPTLLMSGLPLHVGLASGPARIIRHRRDLTKVREGEVLVLVVPSLFGEGFQSAAAIIAEGAHVGHELRDRAAQIGLPAVSGRRAAAHIGDGMVVTVDGITGRVFKGAVRHQNMTHRHPPHRRPDRLTKLFLSLGRERVSNDLFGEADGIGLVKGNELVTAHGFHPRFLLEEQRGHQLSQVLAKRFHDLASRVPGLPVIYRFTDFSSHAGRHLEGGERIEARERNPLLGYRGAIRFVREPDLFTLELDALAAARDGFDHPTLGAMLPFVRTPAEWEALRTVVVSHGLGPETGFQLWLSLDLPANLWQLDEYFACGVDGLSLDLGHLTQFFFGLDPDNARLSAYQLHDQSPLIDALLFAIQKAHAHRLPVLLHLDRLPLSPHLADQLIAAGVTGFTVAPSAFGTASQLVTSLERKALYEAVASTTLGDPHPLW